MSKEFNITGTCIPDLHYMADVSGKLHQTLNLIEKRKYFIISRPRQFGKTTMLVNLQRTLFKTNEYFPISISFEGLGEAEFVDAQHFSRAFLHLLTQKMGYAGNPVLLEFLEQKKGQVNSLAELSILITDLVRLSQRKVVLLIDEVDKSSNNQLFLDFLGMLRTKYLEAMSQNDLTFHSVILAGTTLKNPKFRRNAASTSRSPIMRKNMSLN